MTPTPRGLLITGFGPFPGAPRNPSGRLALRVGTLARLRWPGEPIRALVLRTAYDAIPLMLEPALAQGPAAILMIGVATRSTRVRVEASARNRASRLFPDASGRPSPGLLLERDGPAARRGAALAQALAILRRNGVPASPSQDAGRYLCNASYFRTLREGRAALFLHIPPAPKASRKRSHGGKARRGSAEARLAAALLDVARALLLSARAADRARPPG